VSVHLKTLVEFGLSEKEATIYLALVETPLQLASTISERTHLNRSTVYVVLQSLSKLGLCNVSVTADPDNLSEVRHFSAIAPGELLNMAKERAIKAELIREKIEAMIPDLHKSEKIGQTWALHNGKVSLFVAGSEPIIIRDKKLAATLQSLVRNM